MAIQVGTITLDGLFTDWLATDAVMTSENTVTGYQAYGALLNDATLGENYVIGIDATIATDPVIAANTFIYLNTDQNTATGYSPFGNVGAEYYVQFSPDSNGVLQPYLYSVTSTGVATLLNNAAPLDYGMSGNGESVELAIPQGLLTPTWWHRADLDQFCHPHQQWRSRSAGQFQWRSAIHHRRPRGGGPRQLRLAT